MSDPMGKYYHGRPVDTVKPSETTEMVLVSKQWLQDLLMDKGIAAERERCAKVCEEIAGNRPDGWDAEDYAWADAAMACAAAIRRGDA